MLEGLFDSFRLDYDDSEEEYDEEYEDRGRNVVSYKSHKDKRNEMVPKREEQASNIVIVKPKRVEEAIGIIDHLMKGNSITIDLQNAEERDKQRIIDMISGYCYGFDCNIEKVNSDIFVVSHIGIQAE